MENIKFLATTVVILLTAFVGSLLVILLELPYLLEIKQREEQC